MNIMTKDSYDESTIKKLVDKLNHYTELYENSMSPISDKEWDEMYFDLMKMESETGIYLPDSPTQIIYYNTVNELKKVAHSHPMLSLDKTKSIDELKAFVGNKEYITMAKLDGLTCSLTYRGGRLVGAETRGNGEIGEDIFHNALVVRNIPKKINIKEELVVDGEIICDYNSFKKFENEYKNPRNFAAGSIRLLDSEECAKRNLSFIAWDTIGNSIFLNPPAINEKTLSYKLYLLRDLGFTIAPYVVKGKNEIDSYIHYIKLECEERGYPIDGIVIKYNDIDEYDAAGRTDHHFKGGIAYKFYDEEYETELLDIEWTMGRTGQLTPVAIYKDVEIDGTICNRASLHNISIMNNLLGQPFKGQKIWIYKSNMIIPQISKAEMSSLSISLLRCSKCPICGEPTSIHKDNDSKVLYCDNPNCEGKIINIIDHFAGKKGLDIKGFSKATIEKLLDWGWLGDRYSIFELKEFRNQWIKKPGFGVASVDKILNSIEESKHTTLDKVIAAAGIPEIGSRVAKDLANYYEDWGAFRAARHYMNIDGIGEVMNNNLINYDYTEMDNIVKNFLEIENYSQQQSSQALEGKVFCITGKTNIFKNRAELTADIESKGGKVVSSISSKVNYLINNDNTSETTKNKAAQAAGIKIITEAEYLKLS